MTPDQVVAALQLPAGCQVDQRIAKKLLVEHGAPTAADKRRINEGVEDLYWVATLKPTTVGVPAFRDDVREYLEIAVMSASLRDDADVTRIVELIHRAIPYPVVLVSTQAGMLDLSVAHKRASQGPAGATVLDGSVVATGTGAVSGDPYAPAFIEALSISRQPRADLFALYDGWMNAVFAVHAARVTGSFTLVTSAEQASVRRRALGEYNQLNEEIIRLRSAATRERQLRRQVELSLQVRQKSGQLAIRLQELCTGEKS